MLLWFLAMSFHVFAKAYLYPAFLFRVVYTDDESDLTVKQVIRSSSGGSDGKVSIRRTD